MADEIEVVEDVQQSSPNDVGASRDATNPPTDSTGATAGTDAALDQLSAKVDELGKQYEDGNKEVSQRLDSVEKGLADNTALMRGASDETANAENTTYTVQISDEQWQQMRESWLWAKSLSSVALFLGLVLVLVVAALFGSRLWSAFTKGWRS